MPDSSVTLRFYGELNDLLPLDQRFRAVSHRLKHPLPVSEMIEASAVPLTQVELVVVNGQSVELTTCVRGGDRVAVYPMFETFDVTPELRIRDHALRRLRFVVDPTLPGLATALVGFGLDAITAANAMDAAEKARREGRILLTRDTALNAREGLDHACCLRAGSPSEQLTELWARLQMD